MADRARGGRGGRDGRGNRAAVLAGLACLVAAGLNAGCGGGGAEEPGDGGGEPAGGEPVAGAIAVAADDLPPLRAIAAADPIGPWVAGEDRFVGLHARPGEPVVFVQHGYGGTLSRTVVRAVDLGTGRVRRIEPPAGDPPRSFRREPGLVAPLPDGRVLVAAENGGRLRIRAPERDRLDLGPAVPLFVGRGGDGVDRLPFHAIDGSRSDRVSPDGRLVLVAAGDGDDWLASRLGMLDLEDGACLAGDLELGSNRMLAHWRWESARRAWVAVDDLEAGGMTYHRLIATGADGAEAAGDARIRGLRVESADGPALARGERLEGFAGDRPVVAGGFPASVTVRVGDAEVFGPGDADWTYPRFRGGGPDWALFESFPADGRIEWPALLVHGPGGERRAVIDPAADPRLRPAISGPRATGTIAIRHPLAEPGDLDLLVLHPEAGLLRLRLGDGDDDDDVKLEPIPLRAAAAGDGGDPVGADGSRPAAGDPAAAGE